MARQDRLEETLAYLRAMATSSPSEDGLEELPKHLYKGKQHAAARNETRRRSPRNSTPSSPRSTRRSRSHPITPDPSTSLRGASFRATRQSTTARAIDGACSLENGFRSKIACSLENRFRSKMAFARKSLSHNARTYLAPERSGLLRPSSLSQ